MFQCQFTDKKPPYSFSCLIALAIDRAPEKKLTISQIYAWIEENFPFFKRAQSSWKVSRSDLEQLWSQLLLIEFLWHAELHSPQPVAQ